MLLLDTLPKAIDFGMDEINKGIAKNVKGPAYGVKKTASGNQIPKRGPGTGKMPIPRITGNLAKSIQSSRPTSLLGAIYSNKTIAPYSFMVHEGTRFQKKRPFLKNAVDERRQAILNRWKYLFEIQCRKWGLS